MRSGDARITSLFSYLGEEQQQTSDKSAPPELFRRLENKSARKQVLPKVRAKGVGRKRSLELGVALAGHRAADEGAEDVHGPVRHERLSRPEQPLNHAQEELVLWRRGQDAGGLRKGWKRGKYQSRPRELQSKY